MTRNIETADTAVKLILAIAIIIFYFSNLISGPLAAALLILSTIVLLIFLAKAIFSMTIRD